MRLLYKKQERYYTDESGQWILASSVTNQNQPLRVGVKAQGFLLPDYVNHTWNDTRHNWDSIVTRPSQR